MLVVKHFNKVGSKETYKGEFKELITEGKAEMDILCPISKLTGFPRSIPTAIMLLTDGQERLMDSLLVEIPPIANDDRISDDEKLQTLVSRLDSGSFAENDRVIEILGNIAKEFFPSADVEKVVDQTKINFSDADAQTAES